MNDCGSMFKNTKDYQAPGILTIFKFPLHVYMLPQRMVWPVNMICPFSNNMWRYGYSTGIHAIAITMAEKSIMELNISILKKVQESRHSYCACAYYTHLPILHFEVSTMALVQERTNFWNEYESHSYCAWPYYTNLSMLYFEWGIMDLVQECINVCADVKIVCGQFLKLLSKP